MKKYHIVIAASIAALIACLAVSCSKEERVPVDPDRLLFSKWVVVSTTDSIIPYHEIGWGDNEVLLAVDDTVSFGTKTPRFTFRKALYISRPNESRYYDYRFDDSLYYLYYWRCFDYDIIEDNRTICINLWYTHNFDVIEYNKKQLTLRYDQTGAEVTLKKL